MNICKKNHKLVVNNNGNKFVEVMKQKRDGNRVVVFTGNLMKKWFICDSYTNNL